MKQKTYFILLFAGLIMALLLGLGIGGVQISPLEIFSLILAKFQIHSGVPFLEQQEAVFFSIRLPRVLLAVLVGSALAISGASLQGLFRNPLADPALIGVSHGATVTAAGLIALGHLPLLQSFIEKWQTFSLPIAGFTGGLVATFFTYRIATNGNRTEVNSMLLAGVAIATFSFALVGLLLFISDDAQVRTISFWMLGSLSSASWFGILPVLILVITAIFFLLLQGKNLNSLLLGEATAFHMGLDVEKSKKQVIVFSCLATGAVVCVSGLIGFVGLVVPHLVRMNLGSDNRLLLPASAILGAMLLVICDLIARTIVMPAELPIGVVTSLLGAPFFLWLIYKQRSQAEV